MNVEVVCFGETMALVTPDPPVPLETAHHLVLSHAGAESNVAVSLARLGHRVQWCSRLGADPFGRRILADVAAAGVDIAPVVVTTSARTGVFFKDPAGGSTSVLYYRDGSAASAMDATDAERALLRRPHVLHLSGITAALSDSCARAVARAIDLAHELGTTVSFDVNFRPALWPDPTAAAEDLLRIAQRCDVVFVGLDEARALWGVVDEAGVRALLGGPQVVVVKDGARSAGSFEDGQHVVVPALAVEVVEVVGAGDAFAAGWLHARLRGLGAAAALRCGHLLAAASLASPTDHGDAVSGAVIDALVGPDAPWPPGRWPRLSSSGEAGTTP